MIIYYINKASFHYIQSAYTCTRNTYLQRERTLSYEAYINYKQRGILLQIKNYVFSDIS